jgi:hypothetical protein
MDEERETELQTSHVCLTVSAEAATASILCSLQKPDKHGLVWLHDGDFWDVTPCNLLDVLSIHGGKGTPYIFLPNNLFVTPFNGVKKEPLNN